MITLTNLNAMRSAAAMAESNADIKTSMERLSTGSRINSASDDAAGLAISTRMTTQSIELAQSAENASSAISMIKTADEAMSTVVDLLQRIREISVQGANGTSTAADSVAIDKEVQALQGAAISIMDSTEWNGTKIFDGTIGTGGEVKFVLGSGNNQFVSHTFDQQTASAVDLTTDNALLRTSKVGMTVEKTTPAVSLQPATQLFKMIDWPDSATRHYYANTQAQDTFTVSIDGELFNGTFTGGGYGYPSTFALDDLSGGEGTLTLSSGKEIRWFNGSAISWEDFTLDFIEFDRLPYIEYISTAPSLLGVEENVYRSSHPLRYGPPSYFEGLGLTNEGPDRGYGFESYLMNPTSSRGLGLGSYESPSVAQPEQWTINLDGFVFSVGDTISVNVNEVAYSYTVAGVDSDGVVTSIAEPSTRPQIPEEPWTIGLSRQEAEVVASVSGGNILLTADRAGYWEYDENLVRTHDDDGGRIYDGQVARWDGSFDVSLNLPTEVDSWRLSLGDANYSEGDTVALKIDGVPHIFEVTSVNSDNEITGITQHGSSVEVASTMVQISSTSSGNAINASIDPPNRINIEGSVANDTFVVTAISATNFGSDLANDTVFTGILSGVSLISSASPQGASKALATIDKTIETLSGSQASNGATLNSLYAQYSNLENQKIEVSRSLSVVTDTNYANETAEVASAQIRNQGAKAMLAQANTDQELTLQLIEDWL